MNMLFNEVGRIVDEGDRFDDPLPRYIAAQSASWVGRKARVQSTTSSTTIRFHVSGTARDDGNRVVARCASSAGDPGESRNGATWSMPKQR